MTTITFSKENFPTLGFEEFTSQWNAVGLTDLGQTEQDFMTVFMSYAAAPGSVADLNLDDILLVKAAEGGTLRDIYGPSVFKNSEDQLVLKVGKNEFPITHKGGLELRVGQLEGQISFADKPISITVKEEDGEEYEIDLYPATLDLLPDDGADYEFRCRCSWEASRKHSPSSIKQTLKRGASIAPFFRLVPTPGTSASSTVKMQDLGEGEFEVVAYRTIKTENYGDRYVLELADGREVWTRGNVETVLKDAECRQSIKSRLDAGLPVTLAVTKIQQKKDKFYVDCALRFREVNPNENKPKKQTEAIAPISVSRPDEERVPVGAGASNGVDLEDIPF